MITFHIITLFPEVVTPYLTTSMLLRAQKQKKIRVVVYNPRDFTTDIHRKADDKPYGGGPGMVLKAGPILSVVKKIKKKYSKAKVLITAPQGIEFNRTHAKKFAKLHSHIILIAGHYEGIDARVRKALRAQEISIGPYTLTGGEVPSLVIVDAIVRQIPGVLGNPLSLEENRTASADVYTRPETLVFEGKKYRVPKILRSGNHKDIESWRIKHKKSRK